MEFQDNHRKNIFSPLLEQKNSKTKITQASLTLGANLYNYAVHTQPKYIQTAVRVNTQTWGVLELLIERDISKPKEGIMEKAKKRELTHKKL